jgi:ferredoxin
VSSAPAIRIDGNACMGSGTCLFHAPHVFAIDPATNLAYVVDPRGDALDDVRDAEEACPTQAIHVDTTAAG